MRKITFSILFSFCCMFGFAQTFPGTGTPVDTQNGQTGTDATCGTAFELNLTVDVTGVGVLGTSNVLDQVDIDITHTWAGDVNVTLIAPDGTTTAELTSGNGGGGDDYSGTQFRDDAATSITAGAAPFTGAFQPEQPLATFNGVDADGTWTLNFCDSAGGDVGTFNSWALTFAVPCFADAGALTADVNPVELDGTTTISATPDGNINIPTDYEVWYVLTEGPTLVIQDVNDTAPSFDVTVAGEYTIHTLVAETSDNTSPNFLDLSIVVPGTTTGGDVLTAIDSAGICASLDVAGAPISVQECTADAGTLTADASPVQLIGTTTISATANGDIFIPTDYEVWYVLTEGPTLVIQDVNNTAPSFDVTAEGNYIIHTLVAETSDNTSPDFLDLSIVVPGTTTGGDVLTAIASAGICASLDVAGAPVSVFEFTNDNFADAIALSCDDNVISDTSLATLDEDDAPDGFGADNDAPNVWYSYTGSGTPEEITIDLCASGYDTAFLVYTGTSGNLSIVGGNDDNAAQCGPGFRSYGSFSSDGTTTYYICVTGFGPTNVGPVDLTLTCAAVIPPPANDECANAEVLTLGVQTSGTTEGATQNGAEEQPTCDTFGTIADVWYSVTTTDLGNLVITTAITGTSDQANVAVYTACGGLQADQIACSDANGGETVTINDLAAGTYFIRVWSDGVAPAPPTSGRIEGTFDITADFTLSNGPDLNNPSAFSYYPNPVQNTLTLNAASSNIDSVVMFNMLGQQVMQVTPNSLTSELDMSNLQTGTYFVRVTVASVTKTIRVVKQ